MEQLPRPVTTADKYLAAIHYELFTLRQALVSDEPEAQEQPLSPSLLQEPAGPEPIPAGFPGKKELEAAGFEALDEVPRTAKSLKKIPGIGDVTATQILRELSKGV